MPFSWLRDFFRSLLGGSRRLRNDDRIATRRPTELKNGQARTSDVFTAYVSDIEHGLRHPAMFPASLCERLIRTFSQEGDFCLDPFAGSGTTLVSAQKLGRTFVGFDLNPKYVQIAKDRLAKASLDESTQAVSPGGCFCLRPDFPQRPHLRSAFMLSKGLNDSDVRLFNSIADRTVTSTGRNAAVSLSLSELADLTGLSRRTVIRSLERLRDTCFIETQRDDERNYHDGALVSLHPSLLLPAIGDSESVNVTTPLNRNRKHARSLTKSRKNG